MRRFAFGVGLLLIVTSAGWAFASPSSLTLPVFEITRLDPIGTEQFWSVRDLLVTEDGFWILSADEPFLTRLDLGGRVLARLGSRGEGPGELESPETVFQDQEGVGVVDPHRARAVVLARGSDQLVDVFWPFHQVGRIRSIIPQVSHLDPYKVRRLGDQLVAAQFNGDVRFPRDLAGGVLVALPQGPSIAALSKRIPLPSDPRFLVQAPLWEVCGDRIVLLDTESLELRWLSGRGMISGRLTVPLSSTKIGRPIAEAFLAELGRAESAGMLSPQDIKVKVDRILAENPRLFPKRAPVATDLLCDAGLVMLRAFDPAAAPLGQSDRWMVASEAGVAAFVRFPSTFEPKAIVGGRVVGLERDATGLQTLAAAPLSVHGTLNQQEES